ncbi:MAG: hypothetical protein ACTSYU_10640 [Promethearchaeota archaeon]
MDKDCVTWIVIGFIIVFFTAFIAFFPEVFFGIRNEITINGSNDLGYEEGSIGHTISWIITDTLEDEERTYEITRNGTSVVTGAWSSGTVVNYNVDGLPVGSYVYNLRANAKEASYQDESIMVTVFAKEQGITISTSANFTYGEGTLDNNISWTITGIGVDSGPYQITNDSSIISTGTWYNGTPIVWNVDGLSLGTYNYTINATGGTADSKESVVGVTVEDHSIEIQPSSDLTFEQGTGGNDISWFVGGEYIKNGSYEIFRNGSSVASGEWNSGTPIIHNVDLLDLGFYNFTLRASGTAVDTIESSINVTVIEPITIRIEISPSHTDVFRFVNGTIGNNISWTIYGVGVDSGNYEIYRNGTFLVNGSWSARDSISLIVDEVPLGSYVYYINVTGSPAEPKDETIEVISMTQEDYDAYIEENPIDIDDDADDDADDGADDGGSGGTSGSVPGYNWWIMGSISVVCLIVLKKRIYPYDH